MMNDSNNNTRRGVVNGQSGTWVPVEAGKVPDNISTDPNRPSIGADNSYYFATPYAVPGQNAYGYPQQPYAGGPRPISANMNNAIPTPSNIVQLPPIVQPIAMVPYASQNQPLVQYDPNVRPDVPETRTPEPVYRKRPFIGLSIITIILTLIALVIGSLIPMEKHALSNVLNLIQQNQVAELLTGNMDQLIPVVIGALYALAFLFIVIVLIDGIVKLCKLKAVRRFNVLSLLALLFLIAAVVLSYVMLKIDLMDCISGIAMAVLVLVMMIIVAFGNREALVMDYIASKQTFLMR
ncbi:MAG: hypothetical protein J5781_03525 [Clostridia bacterium]|nr:hypothetical protein [Clostridia bacterium]